MNISILESDKKVFLESLLRGDKRRCARIVEHYLNNNVDIFSLYIDLFQQSLYAVGELWEANKISVATEHLATSTTEYLLNLVYPKLFLHEKTGKKIIISCFENELHQIGAKIVADISELAGWDSYFLGANTPSEDLKGMIRDIHPEVVGLSLSTLYNVDKLIQLASDINKEFHDLKIIAGGQGFRRGGRDLPPEQNNIVHINSIFELRDYLSRI